MIEGLVMEVHKSYVIVLTSGGEYLKLKKVGVVNVGDIYTGKEYKIFLPHYAAAAVMLFFVTTFGGYTAYANQIVGVVNISGTKDVKLYISRSGQVKKVEGLKDTSGLKNMPVEKAVNRVNDIGKKEGVFNEDKEVKVNTAKIKASKLNLDEVKSKVETAVNKNKPDKEDKKPSVKSGENKKSTDSTSKNDIKKDLKEDAKKVKQDAKVEEDSNIKNNSSEDKANKTSTNNENLKDKNDKDKKEKNKDKKN
jgi:hypothetical protein